MPIRHATMFLKRSIITNAARSASPGSQVKVHEHAFRSLGVSYRPQREELSNISPPQYKNTYVLISRRLEGYKPSIITNTARSASPGKSSTPIDACKNTVSGV